jgi:rare lipoprotein A
MVAVLAVVLLATPLMAGFAAERGLPGENKSSRFKGKRIPARMKPGTIVTFDAQGNVVVLDEEEDLKFTPEAKKQKAVEECQPLGEEELPAVESGMVVIYDALGAPVVIHQGREELLKIDLKEIGSVEELQRCGDECKPAVPQAIRTQGNQSGMISWYNGEGKKGAARVVLDSSSAAHRTLPFWTRVRGNKL